MSRTNRRSGGGGKSPIKKYIGYNASTGSIFYYDKVARREVDIKALRLHLLDARSSITGFSVATGGNVSSNMVKSSVDEELKVSVWSDGKGSTVVEGLYKDIKDDIKKVNGKFTRNMIGVADVGDGMEMVNLQLTGAILNMYIDFENSLKDKTNDLYNNAIEVKFGKLVKKAKGGYAPVTKKEEDELTAILKKNARAPQPVWFYEMEFTLVDMDADLESELDDADIELQGYFGSVKKAKEEDADSEPESEPETDAYDEDEPPF